MLTTAFLAVIPPLLVAAVVGWFGGKAWWGSGAVGLGYLAGHLAAVRPAVPPGDVTDRLPWLALMATTLTLVEAARAPRAAIRLVGHSMLAVLTLALVLEPVAGAGELSPETVKELTASAVAALAAWGSLETLTAREESSGAEIRLALIVTAAGASLALLLSGSAVLGFLGAALVAALGAAWLVSKGASPLGSLPVAAAVLTFLVVEGRIYASLPTHCALLLALVPSTAWLTRVGPIRRLSPWTRTAIATATAIVPAAVAVALAASTSSGYE